MGLQNDIIGREHYKFSLNRNSNTSVRVIDHNTKIYRMVSIFKPFMPDIAIDKCYDDIDNERVVFENNGVIKFYISYTDDIFTLTQV